MEVSVKCEARHICIRLSGELDHHSAKGLLRRLDQEIEKALPTQLTLDLSGVTFMDSSGIALLIRARQRMQELMKEHKITQAQLATRIGSTESAISRFVSGKTDKISTEHLLRIAKVFEVSTDFLLGEVNTPDRTNFDIEELGLSVQAARNLYTGKANAEIVNRLLESPRFAEVTYMIEQYFDDTLAAGFAGQNQMLTTLSAMLRRNNKTDAAVQAARTVNRQKVPVYQADLTMIQNTFMAALREVKKEIGNDFTAAQSLTKGITQQMFTELTKGRMFILRPSLPK